MQKTLIIYFTLDAHGTEQNAKPLAKYFLERLMLAILQHSHLLRPLGQRLRQAGFCKEKTGILKLRTKISK